LGGKQSSPSNESKIVLNFPPQQWNRVAKLSMAHTDGIPIEYTSSTHSSLAMWAISHFSNDFPNNPDEYSELLHDFENHITSRISEFAQKSNLHIVRMQLGALRSKPGTVPQIAQAQRLPYKHIQGKISQSTLHWIHACYSQ
jgi:hypothetical protein